MTVSVAQQADDAGGACARAGELSRVSCLSARSSSVCRHARLHPRLDPWGVALGEMPEHVARLMATNTLRPAPRRAPSAQPCAAPLEPSSTNSIPCSGPGRAPPGQTVISARLTVSACRVSANVGACGSPERGEPPCLLELRLVGRWAPELSGRRRHQVERRETRHPLRSEDAAVNEPKLTRRPPTMNPSLRAATGTRSSYWRCSTRARSIAPLFSSKSRSSAIPYILAPRRAKAPVSMTSRRAPASL